MAVDYLLEIDGVKGEAKDSKHPDSVEIMTFQWGNQNAGSASSGSGAGAGKVQFSDVHITSLTNKASPLLMQACASGEHIKKAQLFIRKQGDGQQDFYVATIEDFIVSSYQSGGSPGEPPTDQYRLNFAKIKIEYRPQKADGSLGAPITVGWDVKRNVKL